MFDSLMNLGEGYVLALKVIAIAIALIVIGRKMFAYLSEDNYPASESEPDTTYKVEIRDGLWQVVCKFESVESYYWLNDNTLEITWPGGKITEVMVARDLSVVISEV